MTETELQQTLREAIEIVGELYGIEKRPMKYANDDMKNWLENRKEKLGALLDNALYLANPECPDQMLILHEEHNQSIRQAVGM